MILLAIPDLDNIADHVRGLAERDCCQVWGSGFRDQGLGLRVEGSG